MMRKALPAVVFVLVALAVAPALLPGGMVAAKDLPRRELLQAPGCGNGNCNCPNEQSCTNGVPKTSCCLWDSYAKKCVPKCAQNFVCDKGVCTCPRLQCGNECCFPFQTSCYIPKGGEPTTCDPKIAPAP